ncbi:lysophospholipid acyltransferase family protein [Knoellia subterranea]|uniref:1-acyl-sn-glycerol-3-phosphate acyltransferase n=1 Tax=Knoellia subterranea KCTC 19937 TaxID=1385521 RepID=A0A0A0JR58_9MICO|nr:lysophospholipid acyltransferase family protein [Knoellia subterranea]KGN38046.1 1-acyl-sn-glycerol-3-phosphate acyltransferase [Knoellia subterranea KCTC 19937]
MSTYYWVSRTAVMSLAHAIWRPTIRGKDNVPREGGVLLASNHLSFIDSFAIPVAAPRKVSFLAKAEYFTGTGVKGRFVRGFMEAGDAIPVDRDSSSNAKDSLDLALEVLRAGKAFGIYPEGTRSRDGRLYRGRTGVAFLALTAGVPVVPVGLIGTDKVQPVGARGLRMADVTVSFGSPIHPSAYAGQPAGRARRRLTDDVMDAIAALSGQERADAYNERPASDDPDD